MSRGRGGRALIYAVVVLVVAAAGGAAWWLFGDGGDGGARADLFSVNSDVERLDQRTSQREAVPASEHRSMREGDGVSVDDAGLARLDMSGCVLEVYRTTDLQLRGVPSLSAPVCLVKLSQGTIFAEVETETIVEVDWAVVSAPGTGFFVHVNQQAGLLWVIVENGTVEVEAQGVTITLSDGEQAWVWRDDPPVGPRPATRSEVEDDDAFRPIDDLTNGELRDGDLLERVEPEPEPEPEPEALGLVLEQTTGEVVVPECAGERTVTVFAMLTGPDDAVAEVRTASLSYGWDGEQMGATAMRRIDDRTFEGVIDPGDYCCTETALVYTVTVRGENRAELATGTGETALRFCIG